MTLKKTIITSLLALSITACSGTDSHHNSDDFKMHTGPIETSHLLNEYPVFQQHKQDNEKPASDEEVAELAKQLDNKELMIVFGTWCHDSQREVPRLLNLIEKVRLNHPEVKFTTRFHAVAPVEQRDPAIIEQYQFKYVPTIMLFDGDKEIGRIVERTEHSLAVDLAMMK